MRARLTTYASLAVVAVVLVASVLFAVLRS